MIHLRSIEYRPFPEQSSGNYPFNLPLVQSLKTVQFDTPVTFFVGENGSGKSTLLEAIACGIEAVTVGSEGVKTDKTLAHVRPLAHSLRFVWNKRTRRGFFLRAEDFFGYARRINQMRDELDEDLREVDRSYQDRSELARQLASMPFRGELTDLQRRYGPGLDQRSHGESFLALFQSRFVPEGLYLLDEPEAPLSPLRQLGFLSMVKEMSTTQNAQFIIATHSPIILALPGATLLSFDHASPQRVAYEDLEHVRLTRDFLANPESFLRHL